MKREGGAGRSGEGSSYGIEESLEELGRLADTAGLKARAGLITGEDHRLGHRFIAAVSIAYLK